MLSQFEVDRNVPSNIARSQRTEDQRKFVSGSTEIFLEGSLFVRSVALTIKLYTASRTVTPFLCKEMFDVLERNIYIF